MNCKNCQQLLVEPFSFCHHCGAKVIEKRLSIKAIWGSFINDFFGLDNKYFKTVKDLTLKPGVVLSDYINGTRKRYIAPFAFLAIGTAISMLVLNQFADEFVQMSSSMTEAQFELMLDQAAETEIEETLLQEHENQKAKNIEIQYASLKYFNLITFILIPFYALLSFLVFWKPQNYAENLIITCYIQGYTFVITTIMFLVSLVTHPSIYFAIFPITIIYYLYAFGQLNNYSFGQKMVKLLKFFGVIIVAGLIISICGFLIGLATSHL